MKKLFILILALGAMACDSVSDKPSPMPPFTTENFDKDFEGDYSLGYANEDMIFEHFYNEEYGYWHREGSEFTQCLQLEQERNDGENGAQQEEREKVISYRYHWLGRIQRSKYRNTQSKEKYTAYQLVKEHRSAIFLGFVGNIDVQNGEQRIESRTKQSQGDTQAESHIDAEDEQNSRNGNKTQQYVLPLQPLAIHYRIE